MITIFGELKIDDFPRFIGTFMTRGKKLRTKYGSLQTQVWRSNEPGIVYIMYDWESREGFDRYLADPLVQETMKSGGTIDTTFSFVEKMCEVPG